MALESKHKSTSKNFYFRGYIPHISPTACAPVEQIVEDSVAIVVEVRVVVSRFLLVIDSVIEPAFASWTSLVFRSVNTAGRGICQNINS